jgi:hypothetical protein
MEVWPMEWPPTRGGNTMGLGDKIENAAEKAGGKGKEAAGSATGDESLRTERQTRPKAI